MTDRVSELLHLLTAISVILNRFLFQIFENSSRRHGEVLLALFLRCVTCADRVDVHLIAIAL